MNILIVSGSLNPASRSRVLARALESSLVQAKTAFDINWLDLQDYTLPLCDGNVAYDHPNVAILADKIQSADIIIVAVPIYNFNINAALKNVIELTGSAWKEKMIGFLCAAGGKASYMAVMTLANDLMLDFRCMIIPRFVYATYPDFAEAADGTRSISSPKIQDRIELMSAEVLKWAKRLDVAQ